MQDITAGEIEPVKEGAALQSRQSWQGLEDPHRPAYHFLPAQNWMNDPNGLLFWKGEYHLFYQYNPSGPFWGTIHWGHAVSKDLVHWRHLPVALTPEAGGPDQDGCWSGCAVINNGVPTLVYTGVQGENQLPCLATSQDNLESWEKYGGNPVLSDLPPDLDLVAFRDPMVWREGDDWYMLIGSGIKEVGGTALLYHSANLVQWVYLHPVTTGDLNQKEPVWTGSLWECPQLIPLGDKHLLSFGVWHDHPLYSAGLIGSYNDNLFHPEATVKLDWGDEFFYAPQTLVDPEGRAIMWGWIAEDNFAVEQRGASWAGVMSLPRLLALKGDNKLKVTPAPELSVLRTNHQQYNHFYLAPRTRFTLTERNGESLELKLELTLNEQSRVILAVRASPEGEEQTLIVYDRQSQRLEVDTSLSNSSWKSGSRNPEHKRGATLSPGEGETLSLHVFIDHSVLEVFANEEVCITTRIYPARQDSSGVALTVEGNKSTHIKSIDIWEPRSIW